MKFIPFQNLSKYFGFNRGKDNYTQTKVFQVDNLLFGKEPKWVSIDNEEGKIFNTTPEVYAVIMTKADMYSNGVFKHIKIIGEKHEDISNNSEYIRLLENPNPLQSRNEWMKEELIHTSVYGNSFIYGLKGFSSQNIPSALYNLDAGRMKVYPTGKIYKQTLLSDIIEKYELCYENNIGVNEFFSPNEIIYSKVIDPTNPIMGKSPLHNLQMPISNIRGTYGYRNVLITEKGAIGILSNETTDGDGVVINSEEAKRLERQMQKDYGISEKQSKFIVTSMKFKWTPINYPTKDLMLFEEISEDFKKIIDAYSMNEHLFSTGANTTFNNLSEAKKITYQDAIIPYAEDFAYKLTQYFKLDEKNEYLTIDYSHVEALKENDSTKTENMKRKAEAYKILKETGDFDSDEIKEILQLNK